MAEWSRDKVDSTQLNGGNEFDNNSDFALDEMNAIVNGGLYSQDFAEHLADTPDTSEAGNVGTPSVSFVDNVVGDKTFKKFKFSNIKGDTGAIALETATKFEVSYDPVEGTQVQFPTNVFNRTPVVGDKFVYIHENTSTNDVFIVTGQVINVSSSNVTFNIDEVSKISGPKGDPGIESLEGTNDNPITVSRLRSEIQQGKYTILSGVGLENISLNSLYQYLVITDSAVEDDPRTLYILGVSKNADNEYIPGSGIGIIHLWNNNSIIGYIENGLNSLNGNYWSYGYPTPNIYAPLTSGTSGQILQSNDANNAPTWSSLSTTISESSTDNEIPSALAVYNLIQNSIVSALGGNY